ncbi:MAG: AAA family ATPase [Selenomonadaceae bacterium]|nr:AAA family ATPase [Selenomonadaceae bacterium]
MRMVMPIGVDDFAKVRREYYFVDKTGFLAQFVRSHAEVTLFTRPRRFGKTLTMSMLRYFFDIEGAAENRQLFDGLKVADDATAMAQQGTRPVLFFSLRGCKALTWEAMQELVAKYLQNLVQRYSFLLSSDRVDAADRENLQALYEARAGAATMKEALALLLRMLEAHYCIKPVLLLDEYDVAIQSAWESGYYAEAVDFFRVLLTTALKSNPSLDFAVLTGVMRIAKESIFSDLNNPKVDSVLQMKYPEAFGFTQGEVEQLAADMGATDKVPELKRWYDGYRFGDKEIYNPWSVLNYFDNGCLPRTYWVNTSGNAILGEMLHHSHGQVLDKLQTVLQGGPLWTRVREGVIYKEIYKNEPALYTMLVTTGYLTVKSVQDSELGMQAELVLPNRELRSLFRIEILERYRSDELGMEVDELMRAFAAGDIATVREGLSRYLEVLTSSFDVAQGKEAFYHGLVLGLTATLLEDYHIRSNRESGYGRYDIAAMPKRAGIVGMIIECKTAASEDTLANEAQVALQQIADRDYDAEFRAQGVEQVLHYGIAFCGKRVQVELV